MIGVLRRTSRYILVGILLTYVSSFGQNFFIAVFGGDLRQSFDLSNGQFGALWTTVTITSAVALVWAGRLVDRHSVLLVGAITVLALAGAAVLLATSDSILALAVALCGLRLFGQGMAAHISVTAVTRWFDGRSRGKALGLAAIGNPIGEATLPLAAVAAMVWFGWRDVWLVIAGGLTLVFLPSIVWLLGSIEPVRRADHDSAPVESDAVRSDGTDARQSWTVGEVLRHPLFYLLVPGLLAPVFLNASIFFHQVALSEAKGWDPAWFVASYPFASTMNICSMLVVGWLIDRSGASRILPFVLLPQLLALALLAATNQPVVMPVYMLLAGATMGTVIPLQGVVLAEVYGTRHFGAIRAVVTACNVFLGALGPAVVGVLFDMGVSFEAQFLAMAVYTVVCIGLFLVSRTVQQAGIPSKSVV